MDTNMNGIALAVTCALAVSAGCKASDNGESDDGNAEMSDDDAGVMHQPADPADWSTPAALPGHASCDEEWEMSYGEWVHVSDAIVVGTITNIEPVLDTWIRGTRASIDDCEPGTVYLALEFTLENVESLSGANVGDSVSFRVAVPPVDYWDSKPGVRIGSTFYGSAQHDPRPLSSVPDGGIAWKTPNVGFVPGHRIGATLFESEFLGGDYWAFDFPLMTIDGDDVVFQATDRLDEPCDHLPVPEQMPLDELRRELDDGPDSTPRADQKKSTFSDRGSQQTEGRYTLSFCSPLGDDGIVEPNDAGN